MQNHPKNWFIDKDVKIDTTLTTREGKDTDLIKLKTQRISLQLNQTKFRISLEITMKIQLVKSWITQKKQKISQT